MEEEGRKEREEKGGEKERAEKGRTGQKQKQAREQMSNLILTCFF